MADTSQREQELSEPHVNGVVDGLTEEEKSKMRPADIDADMREMERRKRVEMMMNSRLFREELERIIETQMKDGAGPSGLLQQISDMMGAQGARFNTSVFKNSNCVVPINDIRGVESMGYAKGEKVLRCKLAAVFRLLDLYGWTQGVGGQITARLNQDQEHFLVNPYGLLYHEVTASSLVKVDMQGMVVEQGTTNFGVHISGFQLHSSIHAARPDIKCIIHITTPSVVAVSSLKCGLLPLGQESIVIGEASIHQYIGGIFEPEEREKIARNLGPINKVMFLTNRGVLCCGETVEEAFYNVYNTVLACETQLKLMPVGIDNLTLVSEESKKAIFDASRKPPVPQQTSAIEPSPLAEKLEKRWRIGGTEFEALMRMLDNAGFRTGYIYRHPLVKGEPPRPRNDVEVPPAVSSLGYLLEEEELYRQGLWKGGRKGTDRSRWLNSPNVYQKVEILETGTPDPKKITKWVDQNAEEWVTDGSPTHSSTPVRIESALQFVPKNTNPKEFKQLQQQIKDYRRADKISAGPQSHILEGVTWDEAKKMQDASISATGEQVVLVGAASKGIIQRGFQHNAMVYKTPYAKNPFDAITDQELDQYKKDVERKQKGDPFDESQSESEALSSFNMSRATHESSTAKSPIQSPMSVTSETEEESRDEPRVLRIETKQVPAPSQPEVVLSDELTAAAVVQEAPLVHQVQIQAQQTQKVITHQRPAGVDATTEFLNEMRRTAVDPRNDLNRRDCQSSSCSSVSSEQSYGCRPELYETLHLEVARSSTIAQRMKPLITDIARPLTKIRPVPTMKFKQPPPVPPKPKPYVSLRQAFFNDHHNTLSAPNARSSYANWNCDGFVGNVQRYNAEQTRPVDYCVSKNQGIGLSDRMNACMFDNSNRVQAIDYSVSKGDAGSQYNGNCSVVRTDTCMIREHARFVQPQNVIAIVTKINTLEATKRIGEEQQVATVSEDTVSIDYCMGQKVDVESAEHVNIMSDSNRTSSPVIHEETFPLFEEHENRSSSRPIIIGAILKNVNELHTQCKENDTDTFDIMEIDLDEGRRSNGTDKNGNVSLVDTEIFADCSGSDSLNVNQIIQDCTDDIIERASNEQNGNILAYGGELTADCKHSNDSAKVANDVKAAEKDRKDGKEEECDKLERVERIAGIRSPNEEDEHVEAMDFNMYQSDENGNLWISAGDNFNEPTTVNTNEDEAENYMDSPNPPIAGNSVENIADLRDQIEETNVQNDHDQCIDPELSATQGNVETIEANNIVVENVDQCSVEEMADSLEKMNLAETFPNPKDNAGHCTIPIGSNIDTDLKKSVTNTNEPKADIVDYSQDNVEERDLVTPPPSKQFTRQDSLTEVINSIKMNMTPTKMLLEVLPESNISLKYNLDSTNMSLIYSLTPTPDVDGEHVSSNNASLELLNGSIDNTDVYMDSFDTDGSVHDEESDYIWVDLVTSRKREETPQASVDLNRTIDLFDSSMESIVELDTSSNQGSDILELPFSTVQELRQSCEDSFNNDISKTANQIIADLRDMEIYTNASNLVDEISYDVSCLSLDTKVERKNVWTMVQDKLQALNVVKNITNTLIVNLPCYELQAETAVAGEENDSETIILDNCMLEMFSKAKDFDDNEECVASHEGEMNLDESVDSVIVIDEIVHHIVDRFLGEDSSSEVHYLKRVKETTNTELKEMQDSCRLEMVENVDQTDVELICLEERPQVLTMIGERYTVDDVECICLEESPQVVTLIGDKDRENDVEFICLEESPQVVALVKDQNPIEQPKNNNTILEEMDSNSASEKSMQEDQSDGTELVKERNSINCVLKLSDEMDISFQHEPNECDHKPVAKGIEALNLELLQKSNNEMQCSECKEEEESSSHSPLDCDCDECSSTRHKQFTSLDGKSEKGSMEFGSIDPFIPYSDPKVSPEDSESDLTDHDSLGEAILEFCRIIIPEPGDNVDSIGRSSVTPKDASGLENVKLSDIINPRPVESNLEVDTSMHDEPEIVPFNSEMLPESESSEENKLEKEDDRADIEEEEPIHPESVASGRKADNFLGLESPLSEIHSSASGNSDPKSDRSKGKLEAPNMLHFTLIDYIGSKSQGTCSNANEDREISQFWDMVQNEEEGSSIDEADCDETYVQFEDVNGLAECIQCTCCLEVEQVDPDGQGYLPPISEELNETWEARNASLGKPETVVEEKVNADQADYLDFLSDSEALIASWFDEYVASTIDESSHYDELSLESPNTIDYCTCKDDSNSTTFQSLQTTTENSPSAKAVDLEKEDNDGGNSENSVEIIDVGDGNEDGLNNTYTISETSMSPVISTASDSDPDRNSGGFCDLTYNADVSTNIDDSQLCSLKNRKSDSSMSDLFAGNDERCFDTTANWADVSADTLYSDVGKATRKMEMEDGDDENRVSTSGSYLMDEDEEEGRPQDCMVHSYDTVEFMRLERALAKRTETDKEKTSCSCVEEDCQQFGCDEDAVSPLGPPPRYEDTSLCRVVSQINLNDTVSSDTASDVPGSPMT